MTAGVTSTHGRDPRALHRRGSGARSRPGAAGSGLSGYDCRGSHAGTKAPRDCRVLNSTLGRTGAAESKRIADSARARPESAEVVYPAQFPAG